MEWVYDRLAQDLSIDNPRLDEIVPSGKYAMMRAMDVRRVTSENAAFQVILSLRDNRQKRMKRREIFVEGVAPVNSLARRSTQASAIIYPAGVRLSGWARDTIGRLAPPVAYEVAPHLMSRLSERSDPSELIVLARRPELALEALAVGTRDAFAVVDRPSSPGNLGSLIRSADAFGVSAVITTGHGVDIYDPRVIRASVGACFSTAVVHEPSSTRLFEWFESLRREGLRIVGTDSGGSVSLPDAELARPLAVVFGNEATGLSASLREQVDEVVAVPVSGTVSSLNLACAASIVLYHLR